MVTISRKLLNNAMAEMTRWPETLMEFRQQFGDTTPMQYQGDHIILCGEIINKSDWVNYHNPAPICPLQMGAAIAAELSRQRPAITSGECIAAVVEAANLVTNTINNKEVKA